MKYEYAEAISEALESYLKKNHLTHADELIVLVGYDIEIGMRYRDHGRLHDPMDSIDDGDVLSRIENSGIPFDIVTSWAAAETQLKDKACEFYMQGNAYLYKRGYAAFGYEVSLDEDGNLVYDDNTGAEEADTLKPFWETSNDDGQEDE